MNSFFLFLVSINTQCYAKVRCYDQQKTIALFPALQVVHAMTTTN